jgi:hypothetical protein
LGVFTDAWAARYARPYVARPRDAGVARSVAAELGSDEFRRRVHWFLRSDTPFYAERQHAFSIFIANINGCPAPDARQARSRALLAQLRFEEGRGPDPAEATR